MVSLDLETRRKVWLEEIVFQRRDLDLLFSRIEVSLENLQAGDLTGRVALFEEIQHVVKLIDWVIQKNKKILDRLRADDAGFEASVLAFIEELEGAKDKYDAIVKDRIIMFSIQEIAEVFHAKEQCRRKLQQILQFMRQFYED